MATISLDYQQQFKGMVMIIIIITNYDRFDHAVNWSSLEDPVN